MGIVANRAFAAFFGMGALVGCAADSDGDSAGGSSSEAAPIAAKEAKLLAEVKLPTGGKVEFLDADGVLLVHETGAEAAPRQPDPGEDVLDAAELYEQLSGTPAPADLVALAKQVGPLTDATSTPAAGQNKNTGWIDRVSFRASFCHPTDRYYERLNAKTNTFIWANDANYMAAAALPVYGDITHEYSLGDSMVWFTIGPGEYSSFRAKANRRGAFMRSGVSGITSGEMYDHCVNWHY